MFEGIIMEIKTFYCNPLRECSYVAWDETKECVIIDPGFYGDRERQRLYNFIEERQLKPVKVLLTHGHFDHVLSLDEVARQYQIPVLMHPADREQIVRSQEWCQSLGLVCTPFGGEFTDIADGDVIRFGNSSLEVIATPGHTQGGVCFYSQADSVLFSGDTLFAGSIGRSDHPGGDYDQLMESIARKLMPLDGDVHVLPGHGPTTSIGYERVTNPFLQPA